MATTKRLQPNVIDILRRARIEGNLLFLPAEQLDRLLYSKVNAALAALGGRWSRGQRAHVFDSDPAERIRQIIDDGAFTNLKQVYQFFETPPDVAARLVELAEPRSDEQILEPSAGRGRIVEAILLEDPRVAIDAVELDPAHALVLQALRCTVYCPVDFLGFQVDSLYDRVIANPPFSKQQDVAHVTRMIELTRPYGRVVSVMCGTALERGTRKTEAFRSLLDRQSRWDVEELPAGTFAESGTDVRSIILTVDKGVK